MYVYFFIIESISANFVDPRNFLIRTNISYESSRVRTNVINTFRSLHTPHITYYRCVSILTKVFWYRKSGLMILKLITSSYRTRSKYFEDVNVKNTHSSCIHILLFAHWISREQEKTAGRMKFMHTPYVVRLASSDEYSNGFKCLPVTKEKCF